MESWEIGRHLLSCQTGKNRPAPINTLCLGTILALPVLMKSRNTPHPPYPPSGWVLIGSQENGSDISLNEPLFYFKRKRERTPHSWSIIYLVSMSPCHLAVIAPVSSYRSLASVRFDTRRTVGAGRNFYNNIGWFSSPAPSRLYQVSVRYTERPWAGQGSQTESIHETNWLEDLSLLTRWQSNPSHVVYLTSSSLFCPARLFSSSVYTLNTLNLSMV